MRKYIQSAKVGILFYVVSMSYVRNFILQYISPILPGLPLEVLQSVLAALILAFLGPYLM
jgi:hypothetical protein